ncbi:phytoene/squalene synthase family protein [Pseudorhodoplanes sp.]|uniref:phytoene/squalene synthase family protein n=1 Tax=Pseudorhodoplanes sp. TaxID=1934341 RepID=UPI00391D277A
MNEPADYCERLVRDADKDRFLATLFAPAASRPALFALYAFDLETAAVAHRVRDPVAGEIRLQWWHDAIRNGDAAGHPVAAAFGTHMQKHRFAADRVLDLIDARRRALYPEAGRSEAEFELAASQTDGAVFLMAAQILGGVPDEAVKLAAHHAGVAASAARRSKDPAFDPAAIAERHRAAVRDLIAQLPQTVLPAFLPLVLRVERRGERAQWRKQWILWRASKNLAGWV